jgi:hypothetical protein
MLLCVVNRTAALTATGVATGLATLGQAHEVGSATQGLAGAAAHLAHHVGAALQSLLQETSNARHLFYLVQLFPTRDQLRFNLGKRVWQP